jgi:hypothetical protein
VTEYICRLTQLGSVREAEPEGDVVLPISVVLDVDLVQDIVAELEEVRTSGWVLRGDVVGYQRDCVGPVWADERVNIGVVCDRVLHGARGFTMG